MSSLLSRFDLIFILVDSKDSEEDRQRADHVLKRSCVEYGGRDRNQPQ